MSIITITILDPTGEAPSLVDLPDDVLMRDPARVLLPALGKPLLERDNEPISYRFFLGRQEMPDNQTLRQLGVASGDAITLSEGLRFTHRPEFGVGGSSPYELVAIVSLTLLDTSNEWSRPVQLPHYAPMHQFHKALQKALQQALPRSGELPITCRLFVNNREISEGPSSQ